MMSGNDQGVLDAGVPVKLKAANLGGNLLHPIAHLSWGR